jgi:hypothetical protein
MNKLFIRKPKCLTTALKRSILAFTALVFGTTYESDAQLIKVPITGTTASNTATTYPTPFGNSSSGMKAQYIYKSSELIAAGMKPGWIDSLGFNVTDPNVSLTHTGFRLFIGNSTIANLSGGFQDGGMSLIYYDRMTSYLPYAGWNDFQFDNPYFWDGTSDIIVGTCFFKNSVSQNASVEMTTGLTEDLARDIRVTSTGSIAVCDAKTGGNAYKSRPNIRFSNYSDTCDSVPFAGEILVADEVKQYCIKDDSLILRLRGTSWSIGIEFLWQKSTSLSGPWTNLGVASDRIIEKKAVQTESTYYRCIVTCVKTGNADTTEVLYMPQAPTYFCDCVSAASNADIEKIFGVEFADIVNSTPCGIPNPGYSAFVPTSLPKFPAATVEPGMTYGLKLRLGSCSGADRDRAVKVFIDYNQDAEYTLDEMVYANVYTSRQVNPQNAIGDITIPIDAKPGITGMRIVYKQGTLASVTACGSYTDGQTQDYAINVLPFGPPEVSGRLEVCQHDSVVMNATSVADTPKIFEWTGPRGFSAVGPKITLVDADMAHSGTYYVTVTSGGITSTPRAVEIVVKPKPAPPVISNSILCQYASSGKLIAVGENVLWYNVPVGGFGDTAPPIIPTHTPSTTDIYVTQTVNGCVSDRERVQIDVLLKPAPPAVKSPVTYCQLQEPDLVATGENLKWYLDSAGGVASTISPIPPTGLPDSIDYFVSQTVNGCESDRARVRVAVYDQPTGVILNQRPFSCQYDTVSYMYFGDAPATSNFKWFTADGEIISGGNTRGPVVFKFDTYGDKTVSLFVNNGKCATFKIDRTITIRPAPTAVIDTVYNACVGAPVTITIDTATPNAYDYRWNWAGGEMISETIDGGPYIMKWSTPGVKTLRLVVYHRTCPSLEISKSFVVRDRPVAHIGKIYKVDQYGKDTLDWTGKSICNQDTMIFVANQTIFDSTNKYRWSPERYFGKDTINVVSASIRNGTYVRVDVENDAGCKASDSVFVDVLNCCEMNFPNAFMPAGVNKEFVPIRDGRQEILTFRIFSRWGQVVFESGGSDTRGWDGRFAGKEMEMGVYQYFVRYRCLNGEIYEMKGEVNLIR